MKKALLFLTLLFVGFASFAQNIATTNAATNITQTSATFNGDFTNNTGDVGSANFRFGLNPSGPYSTLYSQDIANGSSLSSSLIVTGLLPNTTYKFRATLLDAEGSQVVFGSYLTFTTLPITTPTVVIGNAFTSITETSANNTGNNATSDGGATITDKGLVYGTSSMPTLSNSVFSTGTSGTGSFSSALTGLSQNTTYYARAYATNSVGTSYSASELTFKTYATEPQTQTTITSLVAPTPHVGSLTINYTVGNGTGRIIYMRELNQITNTPVDGVAYGASTVFGSGDNLGNNTYVVYVGSGAKGSVTVTGLDTLKDYYVRISEFNGSGTSSNYYNLDNQSGSDGTNFPIVLVSFKGNSTEAGASLSWVTASELNNSHFILEKSIDGKDFTSIATINGAGTSNVVNEYNFMDKEIVGSAYYRLRQFDFDGRSSLSKMIVVGGENQSGITSILSNSHFASIFVSNPSNSTGIIEVMDISGKIVYKSNSVLHNQEVLVPLATNGLYIVRIVMGNESFTKKFIF